MMRALLQRIRTSGGFGVHSPFAFDFIRETLRQPCAYYAYESLIGRGHELRLARITVRLVARFMPRRVSLSGDVPAAVEQAVTLTSPNTEICRDASGAQMVVLGTGGNIPTAFPHTTLVADMTLWPAALAAAEGRGMCFDCVEYGVIVCRAGLPAGLYKLFPKP